MFSEWHKIDLHIHTDKSKETKNNDYNGVFDVDVLTDKLNENSIEMISLTDHNIINCSAYDQFIEKNEIKVLVGVELDIAITEEDLKCYISSLSTQDGSKIEIKPFHIIVIFKSANYNALNNLLDKMYETISAKTLETKIDLNTQKKLRTTTFQYLIETFREESFFIIAHGDKSKGIVSPHKKADLIAEAQYNILMGEISALEMRSNMKMKNAIEAYNEGFKAFLKEDFQKDPVSYMVFSDNHDCNNYSRSELSTWLKGALDYETLRIGFSDPDSRIHIADKQPTCAPYFIDEFVITHRNNHEDVLKFSPHLNVIIGGRSSGKSLLFNTLVNLNTSISPEEKNIFEKIYKNLVKTETTKIKTNIGQLESNIALDAEVYCQEKIIDLFKNEKDLKSKLEDFFPDFNAEEIRNEEYKIQQLFDQLKKSYREFHTAQNRISKSDRSILIKKSVQTSNKLFEITTKNLNIEFDVDHHVEIIDLLTTAQSNIGKTTEIRFKGKNLFDKGEKELLTDIVNLFQTKNVFLDRSKLQTELIIDFFDKIRKINDEYIKNELGQEMQKIESAKKTLEEDIDDYKSYFLAKLGLRKICEEIEGINVKIDDKKNDTSKYTFITKLNLKIDKDIITRKLFEEAILHYESSKSIYLNMIDIADSNNKKVRIKQLTGLIGKSPDKIDKKIDEFILENKAKKQHEIIEKGSLPISTASTSQGRKASIFLDIKLDSFFDGRKICVLMIDQIEDNIDNKYISENLVELLRELKKNMQIILVTHNPSIAVYGDAENIIICENNDGEISYRQGGLENEDIRNEVCQILDGGDIAFKNRMDKYNIEKLKFEHIGNEICN